MPESAPSERTESAARPQEEPVGSEKDSVTTKRPETRGRLWKHIVGVDAKAKRGKVDPFAWSTSEFCPLFNHLQFPIGSRVTVSRVCNLKRGFLSRTSSPPEKTTISAPNVWENFDS